MSYREKINTDGCYFCARTTDIEVHHIVPQRFNGSDKRENLVGVCERCHKKLEGLYGKRFYEKLGIADDKGERSAHFECSLSDCGNRAVVKCAERGYSGAWYCLHCATRLYDHWEKGTIKEDHSGRMETRAEWIEGYHDNPLKVVYRD